MSHLVERVVPILGIVFFGLTACGGPIPIEPDCVLLDGTELVGGQRLASDPCQACDAITGNIRPVWGEGCGGAIRLELDLPTDIETHIVGLGPDADGDGWSDIVVGFESAGETRRGVVQVRSGLDFELIFEVEGERDDLLMWNAVLGPDISGDGLGDLLVGSANSFEDLGIAPDGSQQVNLAPNPGLVIAYSPITGAELARWEGEDPCQSVGSSIDLGLDTDGDGLGEVLIADDGCPERGSRLVVRSGLSNRVLYEVTASPEPGLLGVSWDARLMALDEQDRRVAYRSTTGRGVVQVDLRTQTVLLDQIFPSSGVYVSSLPWNFGYDFTGDGAPDAIGYVSPDDLVPRPSARQPLLLLPDMQPPVGNYSLIADTSVYEPILDVDADGADDVLVARDASNPGTVVLRRATGELIHDFGGVPVEDPTVTVRDVFYMSRPMDIDRDGCSDFATVGALLRMDGRGFLSTVEIHRCAGW